MSKTLKNPWIAIALVVGLIQVWVNRFYMAYDGISYLDMGDAYLRGDWHTAINGYWNPLYSWVVGIGLFVLRPSAYWEYPTVQLVNFAIYATTVAAFEFFLWGLLQNREDAMSIRLIAYALFLWTALELIRVWMVNPDMLAASVYTAFGFLLRPPSKWTPIALAAALAAGYYAKAAMLPIGLMVLLIASATERGRPAAGTGSSVVQRSQMAISDQPPPASEHAVGWQRVGSTNYYAYTLSGHASP